MTSKKNIIIAVDFDGVLYNGGYLGDEYLPQEMSREVAEWLWSAVQDENASIIVHSCRNNSQVGHTRIHNWIYENLHQHFGVRISCEGLGIMVSSECKPKADVYIDDRGLRFEGTFPTLDELRALKCWWEKDG